MTIDAHLLVEALGWAATATFIGSYLFARAATLVRVQMLGAAMWVAYGALTHSRPVMVANLLVVAAGGWKAWHRGGGAVARARRVADDVVSGPRPPRGTGAARSGWRWS